MKCCKSYPGADVFSDHNMVAMKMIVKLKKFRRAKRKPKWNIKRNIMQMNSMPFQCSVENEVKTNTEMDINRRWMEFKKIILNRA